MSEEIKVNDEVYAAAIMMKMKKKGLDEILKKMVDKYQSVEECVIRYAVAADVSIRLGEIKRDLMGEQVLNTEEVAERIIDLLKDDLEEEGEDA